MQTVKTNPVVKARILSVARGFFIKNGYNNTSIRDIASASGTNVAMVNYYFGSKYNLFEIIFEDALDILLKRVLEVFSLDKSVEELVPLWIDAYYETLLEYPQIPIFILNAINLNPERLAEIVNKFQPYELFLKISERLELEASKGTISKTPPLDFLLNVLSLCIFPFIFGTMATKVAGRSLEDYHEILRNHKEYVISFIMKALKP